jgi:hypothetical protein
VTDVSGGTQWPSNRQRRDYDLTDRYGTDDGTVILTGIQAITRILLEGAGSTGTPAEHRRTGFGLSRLSLGRARAVISHLPNVRALPQCGH